MIDLAKFATSVAAMTVLCVGDVTVDETVFGPVHGVALCPVMTARYTEISAGGVAAVARQVMAFGARAGLVAPVGDDRGADAVRQNLAEQQLSLNLVVDPSRPTTRTMRFVSEAPSSLLLQTQWESRAPVMGQTEERLIARVIGKILESDIVVLVDHDKGALSDRVVRDTIAAARQQGIPTIVASMRADFARYAGATILAPSFNHLCAAAGCVPSDFSDLEAVSRRLLERSALEALLVLQPGRGMSFVPRATPATHLPGSGFETVDARCPDAGVAALALALTCGFTWEEAMAACHCAAGAAARRKDGSPADLSDLRDALETLALASDSGSL